MHLDPPPPAYAKGWNGRCRRDRDRGKVSEDKSDVSTNTVRNLPCTVLAGVVAVASWPGIPAAAL